jgi:hypothetical protein
VTDRQTTCTSSEQGLNVDSAVQRWAHVSRHSLYEYRAETPEHTVQTARIKFLTPIKGRAIIDKVNMEENYTQMR